MQIETNSFMKWDDITGEREKDWLQIFQIEIMANWLMIFLG